MAKRITYDQGQLSLPGFTLGPTGLVIDEGVTETQWEACGDVLGTMSKAIGWAVGDWYLYGEQQWGKKYDDCGRFGIEYETAKGYVSLSRSFELVRRRTNLTPAHHREVMGLPPDQADALLDRAEAERLNVKQTRDARRLLGFSQDTPPLPKGKYNVILADPPWRYEQVKTPNRAIENQYPTMELAEVMALPVESVAADDAMLFLWATSPKLAESMEVVTAWGFLYRTCMVWAKDKIGMGYYTRQQHELLLICRRGEPGTPAEAVRRSSVVHAPREGHSEKPAVFHELIEELYPQGKRLELFSRQARKGWKAWGNQA